jgi:hypothetical protein
LWCSVGNQDEIDVIIPESTSRALSAVDPATQKNELLKLGLEVGGVAVLVAALGEFAPQLLPEALPELSELATSAPELFEAITTRLRQSRLGQLAARLGRWRVPVEGEAIEMSQFRFARAFSPSSVNRLDVESERFFQNVDEDLNAEAFREAMDESQEVQADVQDENFFEVFDRMLFDPDAPIEPEAAREVANSTVRRISDAGYGLYRYFFANMP